MKAVFIALALWPVLWTGMCCSAPVDSLQYALRATDAPTLIHASALSIPARWSQPGAGLDASGQPVTFRFAQNPANRQSAVLRDSKPRPWPQFTPLDDQGFLFGDRYAPMLVMVGFGLLSVLIGVIILRPRGRAAWPPLRLTQRGLSHRARRC